MMHFLLATCLLLPVAVRAVEPVDIAQAQIEAGEDGYKLAARFSFELSPGLEAVIQRGVPLYFTTEVELTRPRWYWFDEKAITAVRTVRISYNVLTRRYHAASGGSLQQYFVTLDDALSLIRRPQQWLVAEKGGLKTGNTYNVALRMRLDVSQLPKPFQINALNNKDWQLSSDWKRFNSRWKTSDAGLALSGGGGRRHHRYPVVPAGLRLREIQFF